MHRVRACVFRALALLCIWRYLDALSTLRARHTPPPPTTFVRVYVYTCMGHYNPLRRRAVARDGGEDASTSETSGEDDDDDDDAEAELALNESLRRRGRMARNASMRRDAYDQLECLRRVHAERELKAAFESEMEDIRRKLTELDAIENARSVSQVEAERVAERAAAAMAAALDAQLDDDDAYVSLHVWSNHESSWLIFEKRVDSGGDDVAPWVRETDVPWPPDEKALLTQMAAIERGKIPSTGHSKQDAAAAYKRAFRKASLRWHPDKFAAKFSSKMHPDEAARVAARVQGVSQAINDAWSALNK